MKDRKSKYPGRVKLTPVDGQADIYDMTRADEPEEPGTPVNKQTLLTDEAAELVGLDSGDNPTPNDAIAHLGKYTARKVGDILETVRMDVGDRWLLCNGDVIPDGAYPTLRDALPYNTEWHKVAPFNIYPYVRAMPKSGQWALIDVFKNTSSNGKTAVLYDANTDTCTEIKCPIFSSEYSYGIFGLTYDGERYILGVNEDSNDTVSAKVHLFTSTDLVKWTDAHQYTVDGYGEPYDLTFDGTNILVATQSYNYTHEYYNINVYYTDKGLTTTKIERGWTPDTWYYFSVMPNGYYAMQHEEDITVYNIGETNYVFSFTYNGRIAFFSDKYWIGAPSNGKSTLYLETYSLETGTREYRRVRDAIGMTKDLFLKGVEYNKNTNEWMLYVSSYDYSDDTTYIAYISADDDPNDETQYRVVQVESLPELHNVQMAPDRSKMTEDNLLRDPNQKHLPTHSGDTLKYIYTG